MPAKSIYLWYLDTSVRKSLCRMGIRKSKKGAFKAPFFCAEFFLEAKFILLWEEAVQPTGVQEQDAAAVRKGALFQLVDHA